MQGKKDFTPKLFYSMSLDRLVPQDDFYRKLNYIVDLRFLYKQTERYYGTEGQNSIDPVVFFKICIVGYLNNIVSDRTLIRFCSDSLSVRLYLGYDLDEELPWHSTISRTRQLLGKDVFLALFQEVLRLCCEKGMECCGEKSHFKKISHSEYHQEYQRQHQKLTKNERYAKHMSKLRSDTVEPVLGTLLNFMGMKKIYARGIEQAKKHVLMASLCYNLKKMMRLRAQKAQIQLCYAQTTEAIQSSFDFSFSALIQLISLRFKPQYWEIK